jgi:hypothetical protein
VLYLRADRKGFRSRGSHEDRRRGLARQRTAAAQLTTALVSDWMTVSCVDQDVEVALLVIFAAGRRAENPRVPHAEALQDLADPGRGSS